MTKDLFEQISNWQAATFPDSTVLSKLKHLEDELIELREASEHGWSAEIQLELADCFILLIGIADKCGESYDSVCKWIDFKMNINKDRKWGEPDLFGVVNHIKEDEKEVQDDK